MSSEFEDQFHASQQKIHDKLNKNSVSLNQVFDVITKHDEEIIECTKIISELRKDILNLQTTIHNLSQKITKKDDILNLMDKQLCISQIEKNGFREVFLEERSLDKMVNMKIPLFKFKLPISQRF